MNPHIAEVVRTWRASIRRPAFLVVATIVLALGVGASAAVFTLIDEVLLKPLPYPDASRLVVIGPMEDGIVQQGSPQEYQDLEAVEEVSSRGMALQLPTLANISGDDGPEAVTALRVDQSLLPTLGIKPILGHIFTAQEDAPHGPPVVIIAYGFWQRHFAGKVNVIGQSLMVEGTSRTVVGVLPRTFELAGKRADIVLPLVPLSVSGDGSNYTIVGRLAKGASVTSASAEISARLSAASAARHDRFWQRRRYGSTDLATWVHAARRPVLFLFVASACLLLLIAVVNLTNLMLLRQLGRAHDMAVRRALGAPSLRIALPLLAEGLLVGLCGSLSGMAFASIGVVTMQRLVPDEWTSGDMLTIGTHAWLSAVPAGTLLALGASALAVRMAGRRAGLDAMREGGRMGGGRESGRMGDVLVVAQVAMTTALLSTAGMFLHRVYDLGNVPMGFRSQGVLTLAFSPVAAVYPDAASVQGLTVRLRARLARVPGVTVTTATTNLPAGAGMLSQWNMAASIPPGEVFAPQYHGIDPGFLEAFHIPLLEGRNVAEGDRRGGVPVALVSRTLADSRFHGQAVGKLIRIEGTKSAVQVVGVVGDTRQMGPGDDLSEIIYVPMAQIADPVFDVMRNFEPLRMAIAAHGDPASYRDSVRKAFAQAAPDQPIASLMSMTDVIAETTADVRSNLIVVGVFAGLALALAASGIYAVMAVSVAAREREFGVRLALGAQRHRLIGLVLRNGLSQLGLGLACGAALALGSGGVLRTVLVDMGTREIDPAALAAVCLLLATAGLLACLPPAWRASRTPPMHALRGE